MKDALELESRRRIYEHVRRVPGIHGRELQRALGMQPGQLEYHLRTLERAGILSSTEEGGRRRYFVTEEISHPDKEVLGLLRQGILRKLLVQLLLEPGTSFQALVALGGVSKSTLSFHLRKLTEAGLVVAERSGKEFRYRVADADRVAGLLVTYRASFLDAAVDRFADLWLGLGSR